MTNHDYNPIAAYPMLMGVLKFRRTVLYIATLIPLVVGVGLFARTGHIAFVVTGLALGALAFAVFKLVLELLTLVTDLLIPR